MKKIENKEINVIFSDAPDKKLKYSDLIRIVIANSDPSKGISTAEMLNILRIDKVLNDSSNKILLEDADFDFFYNKLQLHKWGMFHPDYATFIEDINKLK